MDSQVQEVKDKLNIVEVVGQYVQLHKAGRTYTARCPFHKEKTPSFHVSPERGTYICFGCSEKGDVFSFVQKIENIDFPTALKQLAERAGVVLHHGFTRTSENTQKDDRLREVCEVATLFFEQQLAARPDVGDYLTRRGVSDETKKLWRLGYAPPSWHDLCEHLLSLGYSKDEIAEAGLAARSEQNPPAGGRERIYDRFRGRVMFPLCDAGGKVIAFSGRFFEKVSGSHEETDPAKYVNSPETALFKKSRVLYGFDKAKNAIRKADCILLVEGQFDVVLSHQSNLPFAVAISGTALTDEHLALLGRFSRRLVLALDADSAGIRAGLRSTAMAFAAGFEVKVPRFPDGKDPADIARENPEELRRAVRESRPAIEFFLDVLKVQSRDDRGYQKLVEQYVVPLIATLPSKIEQAHTVRVVAERLRVPEEAVRAEVAKRPVLVVAQSDESLAPPAASLETFVATPFERKVATLLFYFGRESAVGEQIAVLLGTERLQHIGDSLAAQAERLRFDFDREVGEHSNAETICADMFADIERVIAKEKLRYLGVTK